MKCHLKVIQKLFKSYLKVIQKSIKKIQVEKIQVEKISLKTKLLNYLNSEIKTTKRFNLLYFCLSLQLEISEQKLSTIFKFILILTKK
mgnify:FL=1